MSANRQLCEAARQGDLAGVQQALADRADINAIDYEYLPTGTALHYASA